MIVLQLLAQASAMEGGLKSVLLVIMTVCFLMARAALGQPKIWFVYAIQLCAWLDTIKVVGYIIT